MIDWNVINILKAGIYKSTTESKNSAADRNTLLCQKLKHDLNYIYLWMARC